MAPTTQKKEIIIIIVEVVINVLLTPSGLVSVSVSLLVVGLKYTRTYTHLTHSLSLESFRFDHLHFRYMYIDYILKYSYVKIALK